MPIYEYKCTMCGHVCDVLQKIHDTPKKTCPHCAQESLIRLVSATTFQLKGTGWYATDFKNPSANAPATTSSAAETTTSTTTKEEK